MKTPCATAATRKKIACCKKKSTSKKPPPRPPRTSQRFSLSALLACILITLAACARPDWGEAPAEPEIENGRQLLAAMAAEEAKCPLCRDADVNVMLKSPLKDAAVSGYLLLRRPAWIKFVSSNPFGQPLVVATSDGVRFQQLLMRQKNYAHGRVFSFLAHNDLPITLALGNWDGWLTGGVGAFKAAEAHVRLDRAGRGLWFDWPLPRLAKARSLGENGFREHILVDPARRLVVARSLTDGKGRIIARFDYSERRGDGPCPQPERIVVSGLDGGSRIDLLFSDPRAPAECPEHYFQLKKPENFHELYMP
ncbi:MAG: hypothetical protein LBU39_08120 [Desulfobulbaceae bacterium]|jgi:hypothetical protein|nr:hypothetical protein [Desulfobulbaceae bacterium]